MKRFVILGLTAVLASGSAGAQTLFQDTFAGENSGITALNYHAFANWNVAGQVDLIGPGNGYGISCAVVCIDLDGSSGPGSMTTKVATAFNAGDQIRLSLNVSGNQRGNANDDLYVQLDFGTNTLLGAFLGTGGFAGGGNLGVTQILSSSNLIAGSTGFSIWSIQFEALQAGSFKTTIGTSSSDAAGPILDDVLIERIQTTSVVPEPTTWAMMAFGLGGLGFVGRRRVRRV